MLLRSEEEYCDLDSFWEDFRKSGHDILAFIREVEKNYDLKSAPKSNNKKKKERREVQHFETQLSLFSLKNQTKNDQTQKVLKKDHPKKRAKKQKVSGGQTAHSFLRILIKTKMFLQEKKFFGLKGIKFAVHKDK